MPLHRLSLRVTARLLASSLLLGVLCTGCASAGAGGGATPAGPPSTFDSAAPRSAGPSGPDAAGAGQASDLRSRLTGGWRVVSATGSPTPVLTERPPTFTFDGEQFAAQPGCNRMGQVGQGGQAHIGYRIEDGRLVIDRTAITARACAEQRYMDQEHWFVELVDARPLVSLDAAGRLVLKGNGLTVVAERTAAAAPPPPATPTTVGTFHRPDATAGPVTPAVTPR